MACYAQSESFFNYTDGILTRWYTNNVKDMSDIEKLDKLHSEENVKTPEEYSFCKR